MNGDSRPSFTRWPDMHAPNLWIQIKRYGKNDSVLRFCHNLWSTQLHVFLWHKSLIRRCDVILCYFMLKITKTSKWLHTFNSYVYDKAWNLGCVRLLVFGFYLIKAEITLSIITLILISLLMEGRIVF